MAAGRLVVALDGLDNPRLMKSTPHIPCNRHGTAGFTLIELMIAVVVLAVLTALALPSFMDSIRKGRRSEAFTALAAMQQGQESWRSNNANYSLSLTELRVTSPTRPSGYYVLSAEPPSSSAGALAKGYVVTADGSGSSQGNDGECVKLSVRVDGGAIDYGSCSTCSSFTYTATNACWSR